MSTRWDTIKESSNGRLWHAPDNEAFVFGLTQLAVEECGAIVEIELPEPGEFFSAGEMMGEIQGRNAAVALVAPCDLTILESNEVVQENFALLDDDPIGDAWLLRFSQEAEG